jgi:hypothetical protein
MEKEKKATYRIKRSRTSKRKRSIIDILYPDKILLLAAKRAGAEGYKQAMDMMGYVLVAKDGNLVRIDKDGTNTIIRPLVWNREKRA